MGKYILRRLIQMIPVLLIVSIAVFAIIHLIPGNPAEIIAGPNATDEQLEALRRQYGLDQPLWQQYFIWLGNVLAGNLGLPQILLQLNEIAIRVLAQRIDQPVRIFVRVKFASAYLGHFFE